MKKMPKKTIVINLEYFAAIVGITMARLFPLLAGYCFVEIFCRILFICFPKQRKRAIAHVLHAGITSDYKEARKIALANYIHLGKVGVEIIKIDQLLTPQNAKDRVTFTISEEAKEALKNPNGTICASAHYGNWEVSGFSVSLFFRPLDSVGRILDNPKLNKYIFEKRDVYGGTSYPKEGALKKLLLSLKSKKALGILIDQHPGDNIGADTTFFGHPCKTHDSPALLHLKTGAPLMLIVSRRLDNKFHYELLIRGPFTITPTGNKLKDAQKLMQMVNDEFEKIVAECPEQWLWEHRRWLNINRRGSEKYKQYQKRQTSGYKFSSPNPQVTN